MDRHNPIDHRAYEYRDDPSPPPGLGQSHFRQIGANGLGDRLNSYAHSMTWFDGKLYVGTTRSNLCMLKVSKINTKLETWPIECPDNLYDLDMRAQIHRYEPENDRWQEMFRSPMITGTDETLVPRDLGYRGMAVYQGESDQQPALYVSTYASAKGRGTQILRSTDGVAYHPVPKPEAFGEFVTTLRLLIPFKGMLFTSPTGRAQGNPNSADLTVVFVSRDPLSGNWEAASLPNFGDEGNLSVFEMTGFGDYLYAGTANLSGFQVWRTKAEGPLPYHWERVITDGAGRGANNQAVASFCVFKDALYVGGGIQHGGIDVANRVGPAGPELVRINADGSWDLIVGLPRETPGGKKEPLSGYGPGFDNIFNGYFWRMEAHRGWLYLGTFNWSIMMQYSSQESWPELIKQLYRRLGPKAVFDHLGGAELYRSFDGENWLPVTLNGFDNPYNYGIRSLTSTPAGLMVGTANSFGPKVARPGPNGVEYVDNPRGGLEVWLGDMPDNLINASARTRRW